MSWCPDRFAEIVAPHGASAGITFPVFPGADFDFNPAPTDAVTVDDLVTASVPLGYDAVRAHGLADVPTFVSGTTGRIVVQGLHAPPL